MIYLAVPYSEKEEVKKYGAKFDWTAKKWYVDDDSPHIEFLLEKWGENDEPIELIGEDRDFGGNDLFVDLVPKTCWFKNVRSSVHESDWDRLRRYVYERVNYICECCGINTKEVGIQLDAHERWHYDDNTHIQKLMRLIALCGPCHETTHIGFASVSGRRGEAWDHLMCIRKFTKEETDKHINQAFRIWESRNQYNWELDLSMLTDNRIKLSNKNNICERRILLKPESIDKPSQITDQNWVFAWNRDSENNKTPRSGKWLLFIPTEEIDYWWDIIKEHTENGLFGFASKCATAKSDSTKNYADKLICVYTYDSDDVEDVMRVRNALRTIGFRKKIPYKTDADTRAGIYNHTGHKNVSKYYE